MTIEVMIKQVRILIVINQDAKHKQSIDSDTDSIDAQEDLKFHKKPTQTNSSKNR